MALKACEGVKAPAIAARASAMVTEDASVRLPVHVKSLSMTLSSCSVIVLEMLLAVDTSVPIKDKQASFQIRKKGHSISSFCKT
jgi:hypothetical protein